MKTFPLTLSLILFHSLNADCILIQETTLSSIRKTRPEERKPQIYHLDPLMSVCEDFIDKPVCCTPAARQLLYSDFFKL